MVCISAFSRMSFQCCSLAQSNVLQTCHWGSKVFVSPSSWPLMSIPEDCPSYVTRTLHPTFSLQKHTNKQVAFFFLNIFGLLRPGSTNAKVRCLDAASLKGTENRQTDTEHKSQTSLKGLSRWQFGIHCSQHTESLWLPFWSVGCNGSPYVKELRVVPRLLPPEHSHTVPSPIASLWLVWSTLCGIQMHAPYLTAFPCKETSVPGWSWVEDEFQPKRIVLHKAMILDTHAVDSQSLPDSKADQSHSTTGIQRTPPQGSQGQWWTTLW